MLKILYDLLGIVVLVSAQEAPAPPASQEKDSDHQHQDDGAVLDTHESCPEWAAAGECTVNPTYMKSTCSLSCAPYLGTMAELEEAGSSSGTCSPESIQDGTCSSMPQASASTTTPAQPEGSLPEALAAGEQAGSESSPGVAVDESQHTAGTDADSPKDASSDAEGVTSRDNTQQDPDLHADRPNGMSQQPGLETSDSRVEPGRPTPGGAHHDDGPVENHDGPIDMTQQQRGDQIDPAMVPGRQEMLDDGRDGMPPYPEHVDDPDGGMLSPLGQEMPDDLPTRGEPGMHMEDDLHPPDRSDLDQEDGPNDVDEEKVEEDIMSRTSHEDHVPKASGNNVMPEMPEMPQEARELHNDAPRREEEVRPSEPVRSSEPVTTTGAPTLQAAGAASIPPAPGLLHEAVTGQAPLFDKEAVIALHKVVLSLSSGCWELSKEVSEFLSTALGGFLHLPAPLSSIATAFLFFLVALAFFRSLPTGSSAASQEKFQVVKAAPVNSSPALSNDALNALVKQVEALRQEVGSLSSKLHSVSAENANAMMQLRQEMHSMHSERNQTDEELVLSVKEILECLHGEVDGTDLNHCHPNHESSMSQTPAPTHGVASMSPMEPAPATNTLVPSESAMQASAAAPPVPAQMPQAQASMPPAPASTPVASPPPAPAPVPVPRAATPPSMQPVAVPQAAANLAPAPVPVPQAASLATTQAVPNTPPSSGPPPAVAQSAPGPPTAPLEAAGDFGKRQPQPIPASGDPFGSRPQPKQFQASANPFGARPQPKEIAAVKGPFG